MGAAGLTCSTCEMGARGGAGIEIDVDARAAARDGHDALRDHAVGVAGADAARRQEGARGRRSKRSSRSGTCTRRTSARSRPTACCASRTTAAIVAEIPNTALVDEAPRVRPADGAPRLPRRGAAGSISASLRQVDPEDAAAGVCSRSPTIASKRWVYRQYDHMVRTNTLAPAGPERRRRPGQGHPARAGDVDRRQRPLLLSRIRGAARCWPWPRRRATSPAPAGVPIGATNCLNFGNPERPEIMWQFVEAVEGMGEACRALGVPITGGNVSLYNETDGRAIYPTPIIGVVGLIEDASMRDDAGVPAGGTMPSCCSVKTAASSAGASISRSMHGVVAGDAAGARPRPGAPRCMTLVTDGTRPGVCPFGARLLRRRHRGHAGRVRASIPAVWAPTIDLPAGSAAGDPRCSANRRRGSSCRRRVQRRRRSWRAPRRPASRRVESGRPAAPGCASRSDGAAASTWRSPMRAIWATAIENLQRVWPDMDDRARRSQRTV